MKGNNTEVENLRKNEYAKTLFKSIWQDDTKFSKYHIKSRSRVISKIQYC